MIALRIVYLGVQRLTAQQSAAMGRIVGVERRSFQVELP